MIQVESKLCVYIDNVKSHYYIKNTLLDLIDECPGAPLMYDDGAKNALNRRGVTKTDWQIKKDVHRKYWDYFFAHIEPYLHNMSLRLDKAGFQILNFWFQQYEKGSEHNWHIHYDNNKGKEEIKTYGGIYFLELPDNQGTEFWNFPQLEYKEGDLIIFPCWLPHRSPINNSCNRKTSIVFNMTFKDKNDL